MDVTPPKIDLLGTHEEMWLSYSLNFYEEIQFGVDIKIRAFVNSQISSKTFVDEEVTWRVNHHQIHLLHGKTLISFHHQHAVCRRSLASLDSPLACCASR